MRLRGWQRIGNHPALQSGTETERRVPDLVAEMYLCAVAEPQRIRQESLKGQRQHPQIVTSLAKEPMQGPERAMVDAEERIEFPCDRLEVGDRASRRVGRRGRAAEDSSRQERQATSEEQSDDGGWVQVLAIPVHKKSVASDRPGVRVFGEFAEGIFEGISIEHVTTGPERYVLATAGMQGLE